MALQKRSCVVGTAAETTAKCLKLEASSAILVHRVYIMRQQKYGAMNQEEKRCGSGHEFCSSKKAETKHVKVDKEPIDEHERTCPSRQA
ncbi:hypothetical protein BT69DRAFT_1276551 [Atractiella rhizophila]|nr:hypothetical protein BT69DRAFT_1276551 [Atractiella rhizophila]